MKKLIFIVFLLSSANSYAIENFYFHNTFLSIDVWKSSAIAVLTELYTTNNGGVGDCVVVEKGQRVLIGSDSSQEIYNNLTGVAGVCNLADNTQQTLGTTAQITEYVCLAGYTFDDATHTCVTYVPPTCTAGDPVNFSYTPDTLPAINHFIIGEDYKCVDECQVAYSFASPNLDYTKLLASGTKTGETCIAGGDESDEGANPAPNCYINSNGVEVCHVPEDENCGTYDGVKVCYDDETNCGEVDGVDICVDPTAGECSFDDAGNYSCTEPTPPPEEGREPDAETDVTGAGGTTTNNYYQGGSGGENTSTDGGTSTSDPLTSETTSSTVDNGDGTETTTEENSECDPTTQGCGTGNYGDEYEPSTKTYFQILSGFVNRMGNSPLISAASNFFDIGISASCPIWTIPATWVFPSIPIDMQCSAAMDTVWLFVAPVLLLVASFIAFRIAVGS